MNLNEDDIDCCQKAFSELDEDGVGAIKANDLGIALERIGVTLPDKDLYRLIYEVIWSKKVCYNFAELLISSDNMK
jgi:Ca2+-binding EF-hand superfamily protein